MGAQIGDGRGVFVVREYVDATGDLTQAYLLSQICYWCRRAQVRRNGKLWVAKSHAEWANELGIPVRTERRAMGALKNLGFIEAARMKFAGVTVLHVTLGVKLSQKHGSSKAISVTPVSLSSMANLATSYTDTGDTLNIQRKQKEGSETGMKKGAGAGMDAVRNRRTGTVSELAMGRGVSFDQLVEAEITTVTKLELIWKKAHSNRWDGVYIENWGPKAKGQAKLVLKTLTPEYAGRILADCVVNWGKDTQYARDFEGAYQLPIRPQMGFLVKYRVSAVNWWNKSQNKQEVHGKQMANIETEEVCNNVSSGKIEGKDRMSEGELDSILGLKPSSTKV